MNTAWNRFSWWIIPTFAHVICVSFHFFCCSVLRWYRELVITYLLINQKSLMIMWMQHAELVINYQIMICVSYSPITTTTKTPQLYKMKRTTTFVEILNANYFICYDTFFFSIYFQILVPEDVDNECQITASQEDTNGFAKIPKLMETDEVPILNSNILIKWTHSHHDSHTKLSINSVLRWMNHAVLWNCIVVGIFSSKLKGYCRRFNMQV